MSGTERESFIVRILDQDDKPVGAGFLISARHVLTCSHVISKLGEEITLDFPLLSPQKYKTCIRVQFPPKESARPGDIEDIAVLEFLTKQELPNDVSVAPVSDIHDLYDHAVNVCGFPVGNDGGSWVDGKLKGRTAEGWIQFDQEMNARCVKRGFSGTAVWNKEIKAVVGMVVSIDTSDNITTTYMIPASKLVNAWPELGNKLKSPPDYTGVNERRPPPSLFSFLPYMCDRSPQQDQLVLTLGECQDCLHEKPLVCIIHGDEIECHDKFIKRLHEVMLPEILNEPGKVCVDLTMVEWPALKEDIKMRRQILQNNISKALTGNRKANTEQIKEALNRRISPQMISFTLPVAAWEENEAELLKFWLQYWNEFPDLHAGRKLMVFICIKYKHIADNNAEGAKNYENRNKTARDFISSLQYNKYTNIVRLTLNELEAVELKDVDMWITNYAEKFCDYTELCTEVGSYYESRQKSAVPMLELAKKLKDLLYLIQRREGSFV